MGLRDVCLFLACTVVSLLTLAGCKTDWDKLTKVPRVLMSIEVLPAEPRIELGASQQFRAEGTYLTGEVADLTAEVIWESSNTKDVVVSATGLVSVIVDARPGVRQEGSSAITATDPETGIIGGTTLIDENDSFLAVSNVHLDGGTTSVMRATNSPVTVSFEYRVWERVGCPLCVHWLVVGIEGEAQATVGIGRGGLFPGTPGTADSLVLQSPEISGSYRVYVLGSTDGSELGSIREYEKFFPSPSTNPGFIPIGTIMVE